MFYVDSIISPLLLIAVLLWKGLEKLMDSFVGIQNEKWTNEKIIEEQRRCLKRDLKWLEENRSKKH